MIKKMLIFCRRFTYFVVYVFDLLFQRKNHIVVLCYHNIGKTGTFSTSERDFKRQINYLKKNYIFITAKDLVNYFNNGMELEKNSVLLTFDDGYKNLFKISNYLHRKEIRPLLFYISNYKERDTLQLKNKYTILNGDELKRLSDNGWDIGSHSKTHANFKNLSPTQYVDEIVNSKNDIEQIINKKVEYFSYPKGVVNKISMDYVKRAGYKLAFSMDDHLITTGTNVYSVPRVGINNSMSFAEFKASFSPMVILLRRHMKRYLNKYYA